MFLNFLKGFLLKRKLKNSLSNVNDTFSNESIKTLGILIDESYFTDKNALLDSIIIKGFTKENISVLIYKDKIRKNETSSYPSFSWKDVSWNGTIYKKEVKDFQVQKFDMLISYYDVEKAALMLITHQSKALFKVGFATVDKRLNNFMINTNAEQYRIFNEELFKYLKILNKL